MKKLLFTALLLFSMLASAQDNAPFIYGPVAPGDNLWHVAQEFSKHYDIATEEALGLLFQNNVRAFVNGDVNNLMAGAFLTLPEDIPRRKLEPEPTPELIKQSVPEAEIAEADIAEEIPTEEERVEVPLVMEVDTDEEDDEVYVQAPLLETVTELADADAISELPEVSEGTQVASLELLMPQSSGITAPITNAMESLLGSDEKAFLTFIDNIKRDLSIAQEAIETERRAKDALENQLQDLQIQINALTELVNLKDQEISSMLQPIAQQLQETRSSSQITGLANLLPTDLLILLQQAGENQMVLLLLAVMIASITMYVWDNLAGRRRQLQPAVQPAQDSILHTLQNVDTEIALGRYEQAISKLEKLLGQYPQDFSVLYKLCQVYVKDNQQATYKNRLSRISPQWQQKHPKHWQQLNDLYELAWPMHFVADDSSGGGDTYEGDPPSDPVQTKLDLARAYLDIGDHENAVSILEEVLIEGDEEQSSRAQMLLDNIKQ